jgi:purine nucleosidase
MLTLAPCRGREARRLRETASVQRLVVDTDTGIDDALALLLLASLPDLTIEHVTTTHGNCSTEQSTANARHVLDACGLVDVPVTGGLSAPLVGELSLAWFVHGHDGLGDCGIAPPPAPPAPAGSTAVEALLSLASPSVDLLALGPLTNLGAAVREDPTVLSRFGSVTIMGGAGWRLAPGAPDPTLGVGDPNTYHDPEAARLVASAPDADVTLVGLDVTMAATAGPVYLDRMAAATTPHGRLAAAVTRFYVDFYERTYGLRALALHDPLAAVIAAGLGPSVGATFTSGHAVVEGPPGEERCLLEPASPGRRVTRAVASVDADAVAEVVIGALERPL